MKENTAWALVASASRIVGFTGAGISTESGIPDFRSQNGLWRQHPIPDLQDFADSEEARAGLWRLAFELWPTVRDARPNAGHDAFVELHRQGRLDVVITQNIDSLHQRSGLPADKVLELHGAATEAACLHCDDRIAADEAYRRVKEGEQAPRCLRPRCGGPLKPDVILFGEDLPPDVMKRAEAAVKQCDLLLAVGSSLEVWPANELPRVAREAGARLIVVNRDDGPLDDIADAVLHDEIGAVLPALVRRAEGGA